MKKNFILGISAGMLLNLNACTNNGTNSTTSSDSTTTTTTTNGQDKVDQAQDANEAKKIDDDDSKFVTEAASGGMMEVEAGKIAAKKGMSAAVKQFGAKMVEDHSKANAELKALAASKGITLPDSMSDDDMKMVNKIGSENGKDFDKKYVNEMADDHDKDVDKFEKEAKDGKDPDIKAWAAKTLPTLKSHKDMIHKIKDKM